MHAVLASATFYPESSKSPTPHGRCSAQPPPTALVLPGRCLSAGKAPTASELAALRADGFKGLAVPLLRGEWNGGPDDAPGLAQPPEQRVRACLEVLLGALPLWFKVRGGAGFWVGAQRQAGPARTAALLPAGLPCTLSLSCGCLPAALGCQACFLPAHGTAPAAIRC